MNKILTILGAMYIAVGSMVTIVFIACGMVGAFLLIPIFFVVLGMVFVTGVLYSRAKKKEILTHGKQYAAKIYGYVEDHSVVVNDCYLQNVKVHYFDDAHIEREAVIPTGFPKGADTYPIGMTMDIYEYHGKYGYDPDSVRDEKLPGEEELMDDKPVAPDQVKLIAVTCPNCGSSFRAAAGYVNRCPYCGSYQNTSVSGGRR